jgi:hypothetical protein
MDELLALLGNHHSCLLFEQVFLELMPYDIRMQLSDADFSAPRTVAIRADELWQTKTGCSNQGDVRVVEASKFEISKATSQKQYTARPRNEKLNETSEPDNPQW